MQGPINSTLQANNQSARSLHPQFPIQKSREARFTTSNPQIFPSLHPLGGFYRERNNILPKPAFPTPRTTGIETVKKIKTGDYHAVNTVKKLCDHILESVEDDEREFTKTTIREECENQRRNDDFEFRIPKKPKRLILEQQRKIDECYKQAEIFNVTSGQDSKSQGSSVLNNIVSKKVQNGQSLKSAFIKRLPESAKIEANQIITINKIADQKPAVNKIQSHEIQLQPTTLQTDNMLKTLYNNLKMEYISLQLQRNAQHLFQILQQNQETFSKNLRIPFEISKDGIDLETDTDCVSDKSSETDIKEENIKHEIQC